LESENVNSIPTIVQRSKDDCPDIDETVLGKTHQDILDKISKIMVHAKEGVESYKKYKEEIDGNGDQNIEENEDKDNKTTSDTSLNMFDDVEGDYSEIQVDKKRIKKIS